MPHITVRGMSENKAAEIAPALKEAVVRESGTAAEYVKVFYSPVKRIDAPEEIAADIYWMPRPQEMCDRVAEALTDIFKEKCGADFVQITFTEFPGPHFYENKVHY